ncbi:flagellar biosynthesis protein FliQ [Brevibacillus porteri]|jgi:flagellar biosynthesis protein FliQ|uniref:Flagellar biosynthetic protein FliQ n=6 Tax=Brevibacillus TaxID=55080 RepID=C0ZF84_BREBN|nr:MULTISPECIES: flagellar biosynthesis protein FliQ [Bacillales]ATF14162.1 EscS/YscS/HrcS family type III secretion system export apparatus protein [Brevibacillus brevis X23]MED1917403.1 flagellar biosynthesis protein FliQ [Bacillus thuringiensis]ASJ54339.1 EscS/YscS/HrcS family type III secretion system export apparatus protein [Brevibacillus formosus]EJL29882.1 flagellar biosynthetic protein FliQ [Brevibacillus sp. BC25]KLI00758.1 flagellar biosynthesis protein FliQ [Brevibacillus formosus]
MTQELLMQIAQSSVYTILLISAPALGVALLVGLMVSVFQATTQIQEQTLAFIPKIVAVFVVILAAGPWMLRVLLDFTMGIFGNLHRFVG